MGAIKDLVDLITDLNSRVENRQFASELRDLQGMIGSIQSEQAELHEKRIELLQENAALRSNVSELEAEIAGLKSAKANQASAPTIDLADEEVKILILLAERQRVPLSQIAAHLNVGESKAEYWLERLCDAGLISLAMSMMEESSYYLQKKGRAYLVEQELL